MGLVSKLSLTPTTSPITNPISPYFQIENRKISPPPVLLQTTPSFSLTIANAFYWAWVRQLQSWQSTVQPASRVIPLKPMTDDLTSLYSYPMVHTSFSQNIFKCTLMVFIKYLMISNVYMIGTWLTLWFYLLLLSPVLWSSFVFLEHTRNNSTSVSWHSEFSQPRMPCPSFLT